MQPKQLALLIFALSAFAQPLAAQTLKGSRESMQRQYQLAVSYDYTFLQTPNAVRDFVKDGYLVEVKPSRTVDLHAVSFPYARPEVKLFVERFGEQYYNTCKEKLTVTSLTRPTSLQPANASESSVHPTGMAVDLRVPRDDKCRRWLESTLLSLEGTGVLDVTREYRPPHYHVAIYTKIYSNYVASLEAAGKTESSFGSEYVVQRGDTLSRIAERTGTSIAALRSVNGLRNDLITVGQKLRLPGTETSDIPTQQIAANDATPAEESTSLPVQAVAAVAIRNAANVQPGNGSYTVRRGDTLGKIAERTGTTVEALRRTNGLRGNLIYPGQSLQIPGQVAIEPGVRVAANTTPAPTGAAATYVVRKGDSLAKIAERTNTTVEELRRSNGIRGTVIHPGQTLQLPGQQVEEPAPVQVAQAEPAPQPVEQVVEPSAEEAVAQVAVAQIEEAQIEEATAEVVGPPVPEDIISVVAAQVAAANTSQVAEEPAPAPAPAVYEVRKGDSLARIAERTGVAIEDLRRYNRLRGNVIHPGQVLQLQPERVAAASTNAGASDNGSSGLVPAMAVPAAATLVAAAEAEAQPQVTSYSVRKGDTLAKIARQTGTSVEALRRANGLHNDLLQIGQNLNVPLSDSFERAGDATMEVEHKVRRGESLWRIANKYGTTVGSLREANGLPDDSLTVGQVLRITVGLGDN